jgi:hypothetical protein
MRRSRVIVFAVVSFTLAGVACGLQDGGDVVGISDNRDGAISPDGTVDGASPDGATPPSDGSTPPGDGGITDGSPDSSVFDAGTPYLCGATLVANCTTDCPAATILCGTLCVATCGVCVGSNFECDACFTDGGRSVSVCEQQDASAFAACLSGQTRCPCSTQNDCPGPTQTCATGMCFECGDPDAGNSGVTCKSGTGPHTCKTDPTHYGECF